MRASLNDLRIAAHKAESYYSRIDGIQQALYSAVDDHLRQSPRETNRAFLSAFTRFDAELSLVQDTLSELHAALGTETPGPFLQPVAFPPERRAG